jgi:FkbM family methyltransferase
VARETEVAPVGGLAATVKRRLGWLIRDRFPFRPVVREVQGVRMVLPWSHRLPDYATWGPRYGQNLVDLARLLAEGGPLTVLDVGANVGDSALQILHATEARVLCVEADRAYLEFLHRNVDSDERISVVEVLLTPEDQDSGRTAVRTGGTTRFVDGRGQDAMPTISAARLREQHPEFAALRLVKSDTDGYDVDLVPAIAEAWADARPVLFFEYDPYLTRLAGLDPAAVWPRLERLGYHRVAVWDNGAAPLGQTTTQEIGAQGAVLEVASNQRARGRTYWDVAVVHDADTAALAVVDELVPGRLDAR